MSSFGFEKDEVSGLFYRSVTVHTQIGRNIVYKQERKLTQPLSWTPRLLPGSQFNMGFL